MTKSQEQLEYEGSLPLIDLIKAKANGPEGTFEEILERTITSIEVKIKQWNIEYYRHHEPSISDGHYDSQVVLLRELLSYLPNRPSVLDKPSDGGSTGRVEVHHIRPMLSLRTEVDTSIKPVAEFVNRAKAINPNVKIVAELKYDGLAVSLRYKEGVLTDAVLRGDGEKGESILDNVLVMSWIPKTISDTEVDEIRGEIVMDRDYFEEVNEARVLLNKKPFINLRNAAAGLVRSSSSPKHLIDSSLIFVPYGVYGSDAFTTQTEVLDWAYEEFLSDGISMPLDISETPEQLMTKYWLIATWRDCLSIDIDGVVYKVDDFETQRKMGTTGREPNWAIAHKFVPEEVITRLIAIDVQVGPSGRLTPVARLNPVFVGGVTVSNATLSNVFQIREKGVRMGDDVIIRRAGDVIPEIAGVDPLFIREEYSPNFKMPKKCPSCGHPVSRNKGQANYSCDFYGCPAQVAGKFTHIARREVLSIDGLGPSVADILRENGLTNVSELLTCDEVKLRSLGVGVADSKKLAKEFKRVTSTPIAADRVYRTLAIPGVGNAASKALAGLYRNPKDFLKTGLETLVTSPGLNVPNVEALRHYLEHQYQEASDIFDLFTVIETQATAEGPLIGKIVVVTGSHPTLHRSDIKQMVEKLGGKSGSDVNKKCGLLIYGDGAGSNLSKADNLGIPKMTILEFLDKYQLV